MVEQQCAYAEIDGQDPRSWHLLAHEENGSLIGYARVLPPGPDGLPHVGRVVVKAGHRGRGIAHALMDRCLDFLETQFGSRRSELAAQAHLEKFYAAHGYVRVSDEYPWDGIPHVDMRLSG